MPPPNLKNAAASIGRALADEIVRAVVVAIVGLGIAGIAAIRDELEGVQPLGAVALFAAGGLLTYAGILVARRLRRPVLARFKWRVVEVDVPVTIERGEDEPEVFARDPVCAECGGGLAYAEKVQGSPFDIRSVGLVVPSRYTCLTCGKIANEDIGRVELEKVVAIVEGHLRSGKRPEEITGLAAKVAASPPTIPPRKGYRES